MKNYLLLILFSFICGNIYSQNKYLFPINTNSQNYLSGTMGELRGDHFHMGIDIKTFGKTGYPVYASENGYIERIRVSESGYGKAIYIKHLDGKKTVYAHLNIFNKIIDNYVTNYQYRKKHFSVKQEIETYIYSNNQHKNYSRFYIFFLHFFYTSHNMRKCEKKL